MHKYIPLGNDPIILSGERTSCQVAQEDRKPGRWLCPGNMGSWGCQLVHHCASRSSTEAFAFNSAVWLVLPSCDAIVMALHSIRSLSLPTQFDGKFYAEGNTPTEALTPLQYSQVLKVALSHLLQPASVAMANGPSTAASRKILMLPRLYAMLRAKHRKYNSNVHTATWMNACSYLGRQCPTFGKVGEKG